MTLRNTVKVCWMFAGFNKQGNKTLEVLMYQSVEEAGGEIQPWETPQYELSSIWNVPGGESLQLEF